MRGINIGGKLVSGLIVLLVSAALLSDFLSTNPPDSQNLQMFYAPPARIHFVDKGGRIRFRPFVYRYSLTDPLNTTYKEEGGRAYPLTFFAQGYRYHLLGLIPCSIHLATAPGTEFYPWGSDELGRDVLARTLAGARTSLTIVVSGILVYAVLGIIFGAFAGLSGGWIDSVLMRLSEFVLALPALYLILALRAMLPARMPFAQTVLMVSGTIAAVAWPPLARAVRGQILQFGSSGFVEAAISFGCTRRQVFSRHMLPALPAVVAAQAVLAAPVFLLGEVILSFLDVGVQGSAESWGTMLRSLRDPRVMTDFWWNLAPLVLVFLTLLALNLLAGGLGKKGIARPY
jgi:peptide/nickel transport system permease protein